MLLVADTDDTGYVFMALASGESMQQLRNYYYYYSKTTIHRNAAGRYIECLSRVRNNWEFGLNINTLVVAAEVRRRAPQGECGIASYYVREINARLVVLLLAREEKSWICSTRDGKKRRNTTTVAITITIIQCSRI